MNNQKSQLGISGEVIEQENGQLKMWKDLQYGMFIHLGVYSQLGGEWNNEPVKEGYSEQIQMWANISTADYTEAAKQFTLERFDAKEIVALAKAAGMKYIVITSKHHDGFCLFDTKTTDYNVVKSTPFSQDVLKLLADECKAQGLKFGFYFSLVDWHQGHTFDHGNNNPIPKSMEPIIEAQLTELMTDYGPICEVWFDMSSPTMEQSSKFSSLVHKLQSDAAINGRIWNNKGDFRTLDDNQIPEDFLVGAWQTPASMYHATWGYRKWQERNDLDGKVQNLLKALISIRARGGNYLLNIGPKGDGSIVEFESEVLQEIGNWIKRHPTALLGTNSTRLQQQTWGEMTVKDKELYLHILQIPKNHQIELEGILTDVVNVEEDGFGNILKWEKKDNQLTITLPEQLADERITTLKVTLADELYIIPEAVQMNANQQWLVTHEQIEYGYNFADDGNYPSMRKTNMRQSIYLQNNRTKDVYLTCEGTANQTKEYEIQFGSQKQIINGSKITSEKIGPFAVHENEKIIPVYIRLHGPLHKNEEIDLQLTKLLIE